MLRRLLAVVLLCQLALPAWVLAQDEPAQEGQEAAQEDEAATEAPSHRLVIIVRTRNDTGKVYCALWRGRDGYPTVRARSVGEARDTTIVDHQAVCIIEGVEPGEHAVAVFHDENGNNDLDTNLLGIPSEGTGASNGEHNMFGPPRYDNARFTIPDEPTHRITIQINY